MRLRLTVRVTPPPNDPTDELPAEAAVETEAALEGEESEPLAHRRARVRVMRPRRRPEE